jgi:hypothetical protein
MLAGRPFVFFVGLGRRGLRQMNSVLSGVHGFGQRALRARSGERHRGTKQK